MEVALDAEDAKEGFHDATRCTYSHLRLILREVPTSELLLGESLLESCGSNLLPECHRAAPSQRIVKSLPSGA